MALLRIPFLIILSIFGYYPVNFFGTCFVFVNLLAGVLLVAYYYTEEFHVWNYADNELKTWIYFTILLIYGVAALNMCVQVEFLVKRRQFLAIKRTVESLLKEECVQKVISSKHSKYVGQVVIVLATYAVYVHVKPMKLWMNFYMYYWMLVWNIRLMLFYICFSIVEAKLQNIHRRLICNRNFMRKRDIQRLHEEYEQLLDLSQKTNEFAAVGLTASGIHFGIVMLDNGYWGFLGILKDLNCVSTHRKFYLAFLFSNV